MSNPITLSTKSTDGKTVRIEFGAYSLSEQEAHDFAFDLVREAGRASNIPDWHQNHVDLQASCPLCVYEVNGQLDRLTPDEDEDYDPATRVPVREGRLSELLDGKFVVVELQPKLGSTRKRTVMGFAHAAGVRSFEVDDKAGRRHIIDVELVQRARVNPGGNGDGVFTAIEDGRIVR